MHKLYNFLCCKNTTLKKFINLKYLKSSFLLGNLILQLTQTT